MSTSPFRGQCRSMPRIRHGCKLPQVGMTATGIVERRNGKLAAGRSRAYRNGGRGAGRNRTTRRRQARARRGPLELGNQPRRGRNLAKPSLTLQETDFRAAGATVASHEAAFFVVLVDFELFEWVRGAEVPSPAIYSCDAIWSDRS